MEHILLKFAVTAVTFLSIDFVWLNIVAKKFYAQEIGKLLLAKPNLAAAGVFYLIYVLGIIFFALNPALEKGTLASAALYGAAFGFVAYATYDLTNLAVLKGFTVKVAVVDLLWGGLVTAAATSVAFLAVRAWT